MFTKRQGVTRLVAAIVLSAVLPASMALAEDPVGQPVQFELGDSWTYGDGASDPATTGYAGIVYESNKVDLDCIPAQSDAADDGCKHLQRVTLARPGTKQNPGVTTDALIAEQLASATEQLASRNGDSNPNNDVKVLVLTVGGNDVVSRVLQACLGGLSAECLAVIHERLGHVEANLDVILGALREAAGDETKIVIATYDNAIAYCPLADIPGAAALGAIVLEGLAPYGIVGLNNVIRGVAAAHDADVADTYGQIGAGQWVGDCLHPNDAGYAEIAGIVSAVIND